MARVFVAYDDYAVKGVDNELIQFAWEVVLSFTNQSANSEVGLIITTNEKIRALNRRYRGKDKSTNVLSFANSDIAKEFVGAIDESYLGDVYISQPRLLKEARELKVIPKDRFIQLFMHGALHLLKFDHKKSKAEALTMEKLEDRIVNAILDA